MPAVDLPRPWRLLTAAGIPTLPRAGDRFVFHPFSGTLRCLREEALLQLQSDEASEPAEALFVGPASDGDVEALLRRLLLRLGAPGSTLHTISDGDVVHFDVARRPPP